MQTIDNIQLKIRKTVTETIGRASLKIQPKRVFPSSSQLFLCNTKSITDRFSSLLNLHTLDKNDFFVKHFYFNAPYTFIPDGEQVTLFKDRMKLNLKETYQEKDCFNFDLRNIPAEKFNDFIQAIALNENFAKKVQSIIVPKYISNIQLKYLLSITKNLKALNLTETNLNFNLKDIILPELKTLSIDSSQNISQSEFDVFLENHKNSLTHLYLENTNLTLSSQLLIPGLKTLYLVNNSQMKKSLDIINFIKKHQASLTYLDISYMQIKLDPEEYSTLEHLFNED